MNDFQEGNDFTKDFYFDIPSVFLAQYTRNPLSEYLIVTSIGYYSKAKYHNCSRKDGVNEAVFIYCSEGYGSFSVNNNDNQIVSPNQMFFLPPDVPHSYIASYHDPWTIYWMSVKGRFFDSFNANWSSRQDVSCAGFPGQLITIPDMIGANIKDIFKECFSILEMPYQWEDFYYLCQLAATIISLIPRASNHSASRLSASGKHGIEAAISYMRSNLKKTITLNNLAASANFSTSYLDHLFREYSGYSPVEYFLRMKIQAAAKDVIFSDLPIREIAEAYGIDDPYYFSRLFKKITGLSPAQYRKSPKGFDIRLDKL